MTHSTKGQKRLHDKLVEAQRSIWVNNHFYCNLLIQRKFQGTHFM